MQRIAFVDTECPSEKNTLFNVDGILNRICEA